MRKLCLLLTMIVGLALTADAQLAGTKWKGDFNVPDPYSIILHFTATDTLYMHTEAEGMLIETMSYKISGDTLTITKEDGNSPCDVRSSGTYRFKVDGDSLTVTLVKDDCSPRELAWPGVPLARVKE